MKQFIGIIILSLFFKLGFADDRMKQANDLYGQSKFEEATQMYETLVQEGLESHELYFNLGNAYYRTEKYAKAVLNYERALLVRPNDEATLANLEIAHQYVGDKVEAVPEFFLNIWFRSFYRSLTPSTWAVLSMIFFIGAITGLSLYFFSQIIRLRKMGFYVACFALFFTVASLFLGVQHNTYVSKHKYAIIYTSSLTVVSAPNDQGSELFVVHEGTKVKITKHLGEWSEIKLADGRVGWVKESDVIKI